MRYVESIRDPRYTGDNRCLPCTIVNAAIAIALAAIAAVESLYLACAVLGVAAAAIGLRGYLVPGTPTLTERYLPARVLRWFDKGPTPPESASGPDDDAGDLDTERILLSEGVLRVCDDGDDLCLTDRARERWNAEIESYDGVTAATLSALSPAVERSSSVEMTTDQAGVELSCDGRWIGRWPSEAAMRADATGAAVLDAHLPWWGESTAKERSQLLTGLRLFVPKCPTTGSAVSMSENAVPSCCSSQQVVALTCADGETIFEQTIEG
ncbi:hypothetical protein [Halorubrum sp. CSM-61]|uniref:hypothetical protein n=1 Tax=Halorubrum sp. CSM-61 TaxID=2485838 RepID=UPI0013DDE5D2|nr:hypothetical protein [Halorubrum sp. CSM-61]